MTQYTNDIEYFDTFFYKDNIKKNLDNLANIT